MKKVLQIFIIVFLLGLQGVYANSNSEQADELYNQGTILLQKGKYKESIKLFEKSIKIENRSDVIINLGVAYEKLHNYDTAIKLYKKAVEMGDADGGVNLGLLYDEKLKDYPNAIKWYKKAINKGNITARKNLGLLYHEQNDNLNSAVYMMGMIGHPYTRERVIGALRYNWKIDEKTLLKAYILQKKLIPNPYLDPEFEAQIPTPHRNRRGTGR